MIVIVAAVVILLLAHHADSAAPAPGVWMGRPVPGGADGSPQSQSAYAGGGGPVGNTGNATAHKLESALGGLAGAGACTYFGAGSAAPLCAKLGAALGPTAVKLGNFTTIKSIDYGVVKPVAAVGFAVNKVTSLGTNIANKGASYADRAYAGAGALPGPLSYVGKAAVAPIKITADAGALVAKGVQAGAGALASGTKAATHAVGSTVKKVLGWL